MNTLRQASQLIDDGKALLIAALSVTLLLIGTAPAMAAHEGTAYEGELNELNGSGASGDASVVVSEDGETLSVELNASGFNLDGPHAMHIHAIVDGENVTAASCPTMTVDANSDGVIDGVEATPIYGGIEVSFTTEGDTSPDSALAVERFPAGTSITYSRSDIAIPEALKANLDKVHIVVHGIDENGNGMLDMDQEIRSPLDDAFPREATAPALCGELTAVALGAVNTGGGGTATSDGFPTTATAVLVGIGLVALATTVVRRNSTNRA